MALITLTTDFGTRDGYVGAMKGVIASLAPAARVVDITHDIGPQDIAGAAFALATAAKWFPVGTIHVVVVDPGVGTERAAVIASVDGSYFVGPDNGVFALVAGPSAVVHRIDNAPFMRPAPASTFHGRDVFAPAAAALALGQSPASAGAQIELLGSRAVSAGPTVIHVDVFGNLITSLRPQDLAPASRLSVGGTTVGPLRRTYADVACGETVVYEGSSGWIEVGIRDGSAASALQVSRGQSLVVLPPPATDKERAS